MDIPSFFFFDALVHGRNFSGFGGDASASAGVYTTVIGQHQNGPPQTRSISGWVKGPSIWPAAFSSDKYLSTCVRYVSTEGSFAKIVVSRIG